MNKVSAHKKEIHNLILHLNETEEEELEKRMENFRTIETNEIS